LEKVLEKLEHISEQQKEQSVLLRFVLEQQVSSLKRSELAELNLQSQIFQLTQAHKSLLNELLMVQTNLRPSPPKSLKVTLGPALFQPTKQQPVN
jgi:hypothetical protein